MHLYQNRKNRIGSDRPQGVNIPCTPRRLIKVVSGDTLTFTANVVCPATREPVRKADIANESNSDRTYIYVAVAENRFAPVIWAGSSIDGWVKLDEYRPGLVHITIPRTVMSVLRRGSYLFSVVVDDGLVRETQLTGNFLVEYEPTGSINDIPYRTDQETGNPISLTPEIDLAAQKHHRLTYDQLVDAVDALTRVLISEDGVRDFFLDPSEHDPSADELTHAVHRLAQFVLWHDELRARIPTTRCDRYDPSYDEFVNRLCQLLKTAGIGWQRERCTPIPR